MKQRDLEAEFNAVLEAAVEGIVVTDDQGVVEVFSQAAERIFGYSAREVIGENVWVLMPTPHRESHDLYLHTFLKTRNHKIRRAARRLHARRKDGSLVPIDLSVSEVLLSDARVRFMGVVRDITRQVAAEAELRNLQERLAHAGRIGTVSEMATGIAHEINQPLSAIASYAQACRRMLESSSGDRYQILRAVNEIDKQAIRAGSIIERLRSFVRMRHDPRSKCDTGTLIREVVEMVKSDTLLKGVHIDIQLDDGLPAVIVDGIQIQQVVLNLVLNGIESMQENPDGERHLTIGTACDAEGNVVVSIRDVGAGLPRELVETLFDPYVTTKSNGLGMGLSISRTIVQAHGGRLWFVNNPDRGTTFRFSIPTVKEGVA